MDSMHAIILGLIQGVAEALPISSSAHLLLYKYFANAKEVPIFFDLLLHVATVCSVMIVFRKKIVALIASFFRLVIRKTTENDKQNLSQIAIILIASCITAIVGFALKDLIKHLNIKALPLGFCITGFLLLISQKAKLKKTPNVIRTSAILGIVQGLAVFPGISRSGSTIAILLMLGFAQDEVGELSFILSIPAVLGATILEGISAYTHGATLTMGTFPIAIGMLSAFLLCLATLLICLRIIKSGYIAGFAFYLFPLAIILQSYFVFWTA